MLENVSAQELRRQVAVPVERARAPREAESVGARNGLGGQRPRTQREGASRCGISRSYVSRIEKRALEKLRRALGDG